MEKINKSKHRCFFCSSFALVCNQTDDSERWTWASVQTLVAFNISPAVDRSLKDFGLEKEFNSDQVCELTASLSGFQ